MGGRSVLQGPHQELIRIMCSNHTAGVKFTQHDQKSRQAQNPTKSSPPTQLPYIVSFIGVAA